MRRKRQIQLIRRSALAKLKGCSPSAVTQQLKGKLAPAVVGDQVDASHPLVVKWLTGTDTAPTSPSTPTPAAADPEVLKFKELTFRKRAAEVELLESRNARDEGRLISRRVIEDSVFGFLGTLSQRLVRDVPRRTAVTFAAAVRSGATTEQLERMLSEANGSELTDAKNQIIRGLRAARAGDNPPELSEPVKRTEAHAAPPVVDAIRAKIEHEAGPRLVERVLQDVARTKPNGAQTFDEAMAALRPLQAESTRMVVVMLLAHVDTAMREQRDKELNEEGE